MKTFPYFHKLFHTPLMILPDVRAGMEMDLLRLAFSDKMPEPSAAIIQNAAQNVTYGKRVDRIYKTYGNVGVVRIEGAIDKHLSDWDMSCYGGCDLADVDKALSIAMADKAIERVVLNINSPGGSILGLTSTAARITALSQEKEVHAFTDGLCCSAAQFLASQADICVADESARVGSIGVYLAIVDATRWAEMEGYRVELITAGKYKAMGSPFKPLTEDERTKLQGEVNELHSEFKAAVTSGRKRAGKNVSPEHMEAQVFTGREAVKIGLFDELTGMNLDEYVARLL